ncbi:MAG: alcohol dehydrogenase catalytic domain-containing protein [Syntrophales bacterium]|nr:alcohol dehydrogenase catalytic domain-containing protein [Syntrophales bacterium]
MKAIVKTSQEAGIFEVKEVPVPKPGRGEIMVQVKAASLCYTDVAILNNKYKGRRPVPIPIVMGHEGTGVVYELGEGVENVSVGDRVGLEVVYGCGACVNCLNGNSNMCGNWRHIGSIIYTKKDFADAIAILQDPTFNVAPILSRIDPLSKYQEAFADALTGNYAKIILDFRQA